MPLVRVGAASLVLCLAGGCVLHARQFLPSTGRYVSVYADAPNGGRAESLVATDERGPLVISARVWAVDAGESPGVDEPSAVIDQWLQDSAFRSSIMLVNPATGNLESGSGTTLLPESVVVGARWRVRAGDAATCFVEEEVVSVTDRTARVAHRFACGDELPVTFMNSVWKVGAGQVEFGLADGGGTVRFFRVP